ncbi:hypothetical protein BCR43DRAFT_490470 [Syncephalastrum racemosum]|uniref:Uncharacterized protein n=1 Tax=Syncephalastrum racemosum TaxID=13706 RepID=A0A1X2HFX0_SYNRA|nr:hypothetical protein BCR43DRAFT_490470 [Syncephalastrum racemosum]
MMLQQRRLFFLCVSNGGWRWRGVVHGQCRCGKAVARAIATTAAQRSITVLTAWQLRSLPLLATQTTCTLGGATEKPMQWAARV